MTYQLKTPVAFLIFNRPETTARVFEEIRRARPPKLLVVADGPRPDRPGEFEKCEEVRSIIDRLDWPCEVLKNFSDVNLGCKRRISSGLDWVFENVEEAVILEDDCLPHPTFFRFCEELLTRYRNDESIMVINGTNYNYANTLTSSSYFIYRYPHVWGWATWRRFWKKYDVTMALWPEMKASKWLYDNFDNKEVANFWDRYFEKTYRGDIDTWDFQLSFACFVNNGLCIVPKYNLISNIGYGSNASRTKKKNVLSELPVTGLEFPLSHPSQIIRNKEAEKLTEIQQYSYSWFLYRLSKKLFRKIRNKCLAR
jgi:hypothetical protein